MPNRPAPSGPTWVKGRDGRWSIHEDARDFGTAVIFVSSGDQRRWYVHGDPAGAYVEHQQFHDRETGWYYVGPGAPDGVWAGRSTHEAGCFAAERFAERTQR